MKTTDFPSRKPFMLNRFSNKVLSTLCITLALTGLISISSASECAAQEKAENRASKANFSFAYMSDIHIALGAKAIEDAEACVKDINANPNIAFSVIAGDITEFGSDEEIAMAKSIFDKLEKPYYIVAGNHDAKWSESGCNTFLKEFGYEEFEFDYQGIKFIGTNSGPNMRMAPALLPRESMVWLDSISKTIDPVQPVVFINHYPMDTSMLNYTQVLDVLKTMNTQLIMNGHWHQDRAMVYEGIPAMIGRSTMCTGKEGPGYNIVKVEGSTITFSERIAAGTRNVKGEKVAVKAKTKHPWHTLRMSNGPAFDNTIEYKREDYAINKEYPNVKPVWKRQDNSDIGGGATIVGKYSVGIEKESKTRVVYANTAGYVYALSAFDGSVVWSYKAGGKIFSTPAVSGGIVVFGCSDNNVYALDLNSGSLKWKYECGKSVLGSPAIMGGIVYIGASDHCFRALNLKSGKLVWNYDKIRGFIEARAFVDKEQVVIGDWKNSLYSFNPKSGKLQWEWQNRGSRMLSPAAVFPEKAHGKIFIATPERVSYAIDAKTGEQLWRARGGREAVGLSPEKDVYYIKTMLDTVFAYSTTETIKNAQGKTLPKTKWAVSAEYGYEIAPTTITSIAGEGKDGEGLLFIPTDKGNIVALNCKDGSIAWKHKFSMALINYIIPLGNHRILVSAMDGFVGILEY